METKEFYTDHNDNIRGKREYSKYPLRAYAHKMQYESILQFVKPGMSVLDAGCGDGVLSLKMAQKGAHVTGIDMSEPNIVRAKKEALRAGFTIDFLVGDAEKIPFGDTSFDLVVSSHVLEHLPDFDAGLRELLRVTRGKVVVAVPTLPNLCSLVQVGGGWFYLKGPRSFLGLVAGFLKMVTAWILRREGVDEGYEGHDVPHIFRFQYAVRKRMSLAGAHIVYQEASSLCVPYFSSLLPLIRWMDKYRSAPFLKNCGYGTTYLISKN